jgi:ATP-dependent 26S proteasome regulatory subunit
MTTNHIKHLDITLIRLDRIDIKFKFRYINYNINTRLFYLFDIYEKSLDIQVRVKWTPGTTTLWDDR